MLDRGEQLDWFGSLEIRVEALIAALSFAYFLVHTATAGPRSFFRYELLKDRNFTTGACFIFVIGAVMYATRALLPPMLQNLMGYPVATTGLVTAPSGAGTMVAMLLAGRLLRWIDARALLAAGFAISAFALWQMMQYTIVLSPADIVWPGIVRGFGLGLVFVPLSALTFSTLAPALRADSTATYSLMRNIGSSIGISLIQTLLTRNTQVAHADWPRTSASSTPPRNRCWLAVAARASWPCSTGGEPAGRDDRLPRRLQGDAGGHAAGGAADPADPADAPCGAGRLHRARGDGLTPGRRRPARRTWCSAICNEAGAVLFAAYYGWAGGGRARRRLPAWRRSARRCAGGEHGTDRDGRAPDLHRVAAAPWPA